MKPLRRQAIFVTGTLVACYVIAGCGTTPAPTSAPNSCLGKGAIPAPLLLFLDYPPSGSTSVPTNIGVLIQTGTSAPNNAYPQITINVSSPSGAVPLGTPTIAPSPLPSPFATPYPNYPGPYVAIPMPTLAANTTYTVTGTYIGFDDSNPPSCSGPITQTMGTFTTAR